MLTILLRTVILYFVIISALRLMGKKQLAELQPSELVTTILISNIATVSIEDLSLPMISGIIPIMLLVCMDVIMSMITLKSEKVRKIVAGSPQVIISGGNINQSQMRELRYTIDDLLEAMRESSIFDLSQVQYAIVETTGKINFLEAKNTSNDNKISEDPPIIIINDGYLNKKNLDYVGLDEKWLRRVLLDNGTTVKNIFLLTVKDDKDYYLVKKDLKK
jgi:uncharacterized membrane protein YcaP (DUF421 family)